MNFTIKSNATGFGGEHPGVAKAVRHLKTLADGELIDRYHLAKALKWSADYLRGWCSQIPEIYRALGKGNQFLYGNKKTIAAWRKERATAQDNGHDV